MTDAVSQPAPLVAIIGGGFTGAAVALHLAAGTFGTAGRVVVFEPRAVAGAGLAYDTDEPVHRINVPAGRMSLFPDRPEDFLHYLHDSGAAATDAELLDGAGQPFPRRRLFGDYVAARLAPQLHAGRVRHRQASVTAVERQSTGWLLRDDAGAATRADLVVLATSHPAPALPGALRHLAGAPGLVQGGDPAALATIGPQARVLVVGNGLTAADAIATLDRLGHRGSILAVSRRGLRARDHATTPQDPIGQFLRPANRNALALLGDLRRQIRAAAGQGIGWQAVLDALRAEGQPVWQAMPLAEQRRVIRHLRPFWDVHRFRIAPQVSRVLDRRIAEGRLQIGAARLVAARQNGSGFHVTLQQRGTPHAQDHDFDAIVVTTGPDHGGITTSQPYLAALAAAGGITPCATGLGIACDRQSRALDHHGRPQPDLLIAGPLARGTFGELMGLPQVATHARDVAQAVTRHLIAAQHAQHR